MKLGLLPILTSTMAWTDSPHGRPKCIGPRPNLLRIRPYCSVNIINTPWAIKRGHLIFVCNFIKNQRIFMQSSLLDLQVFSNSWDGRPFGHNRHGPKVGDCVPLEGVRAGSPSNTMWPGQRPTSKPSFILIHPTVWPQYTNISDRQTDRTNMTTVRQHRANCFTNGCPKWMVHVTVWTSPTSTNECCYISYSKSQNTVMGSILKYMYL